MDLLVHLFAGESRFVQTGGGGSGQVLGDNGEGAPEAVTLQGADDMDTGLLLDRRLATAMGGAVEFERLF